MVLNHANIEEYESFLNKIPGIISSKIVVGQEGNIIELHILANTARNPKQISRDVQSALMTKYGIPLDYKVISIAQIEDESEICYNNCRLVLKNISINIEDLQVETRVTLQKDDEVFEGVSHGLNFTLGRFRALAEATINAIQQFLDGRCMFSVLDIQKITISGRPVCIVAISEIAEQVENFLVGSSPIDQDDNKAVVKAVLDALNRKLGKYI